MNTDMLLLIKLEKYMYKIILFVSICFNNDILPQNNIELKWDYSEPTGYYIWSPLDTICVTFDAMPGYKLDSIRVALRRAGSITGGIWQYTESLNPTPLGNELAVPINASISTTTPYPYPVPYQNWCTVDLRSYNISTDQPFVVGFVIGSDPQTPGIMTTEYASSTPYHSYTYLTTTDYVTYPGWYYITTNTAGDTIAVYLIRAYVSPGIFAETNQATNLTQTTATLNGTVNPNGLSTTVLFEYGTNTSYGNTIMASQSPISGYGNINVNANISSLMTSTLYHFRLKASNSVSLTYGADNAFMTLGNTAFVTTNIAINITETSATLNGMINPNGVNTTVEFEYGINSSYGNTVLAAQSPANGNNIENISANINNLIPNTLYHYRVKATNSFGISYGSDMAFKTNFIYPSSILLSQSYIFGDPTKSSSYKLIGLPGDLNISLTQILKGTPKEDFNAYYDNGDISNYLKEFDNFSIFQFKPGNGFWIISKNGINVSQNIGSVTLASDKSYSIFLHSGWNIISNPFEGSVIWDSILSVNSLNINSTLYSWNSGWSVSSSFDPYEGYYFYNQQNLSSLKIPYNPDGIISKNLSRVTQLSGGNEKKSLRLSLNAGNKEKSFVIISIDSTSSNDYDINDLLAPPGDFEDIGMRLCNDNLTIGYKSLMRDSRPMEGIGQAYDINITNKQNEKITLEINGLNNFERSEVYLLDLFNHELYNLKVNNVFSLTSITKTSYQILIGNADFIRTKENEILPTEFRLYQNYPNPFNPVTTIEYSIPKTSFVILKVYNILGKEISTLVSEQKNSGYHKAEFYAKNLSSGIYFYRIQAEGFVQTMKLILMK